MSKTKAVLVIKRTSTNWYPSIREAARHEGFSQWQIQRALATATGEIPGTRPIVAVDLPTIEPTDEQLEDYYQKAGLMSDAASKCYGRRKNKPQDIDS